MSKQEEHFIVSLNYKECMNYIKEAQKIIDSEIEGLKNLSKILDEDFCSVIELIRNLEGNLIMTGVGKSGIIGKKIVSTMASIGIPAFFMHPTEAIHGDLGVLTSKDVLFLISNSGKSKELLYLIPSIKEIGLKTVIISGNPDSDLVQCSDYFLNIGKCNEADPNDLLPTTSTTTTLALGDALAIVSQCDNLSPKRFLRNHPGGSIGEKLKFINTP